MDYPPPRHLPPPIARLCNGIGILQKSGSHATGKQKPAIPYRQLLAEQERYEEALQCFFKLDFMENDCIKAWRAIGWCSFVSGKFEQAMRYYNKILALKPLSTDYLNAGHAALLLGNMEKAAELYGKATSESGNRETFLEMFDKDKEMLIKLGIDEKDIPLIRDFGLTAD